MSSTPSYAAALLAVDEPDPRLNNKAAAAIILSAYLMFFTGGIIRAVQLRDHVIGPTDYSDPGSIAVLGRYLGEMGGAALLLYLLCNWLRITRPMAGVPRRGASTIPSLLTTATAFAGLIVSSLVLAVLQPAPDPNALAGGAVRNAWTVPGVIIDAVHAGVVEEIVIVAIPVLIGRRAGWHPAVIVGLSMVVRWPFHIYHGTWSSLPWAAIWGGAHVLAFLYLRRLAPLVIYHAVKDTLPGLSATDHGTLTVAVGAAYVVLLVSYLYRAVHARLRRAAADDAAVDRDPAAVDFFARRRRKDYRLTAVLVALYWAAGTWVAVRFFRFTGVVAATGVAIGLIVLVGGAYWLSGRLRAGQNMRAYRNAETGAVVGGATWSTSYTGHVALSVTTASRRTPPQIELDAVRDVAATTGQTLSLFTSRVGYRLIDADLHLGRRPLTGRMLITPAQAAQLGQYTAPLPR